MRSKRKNEFDPTANAIRHLRQKLRNLVVIMVAIALWLVYFGCPSIQYTYRYPAHIKATPSTTEKTSADYWNPISGWQVVQSGEYGPGCPTIVFIPLRRCVDIKKFENPLTIFVFGQEYFHGS
jgi:hypothetical protein